MNDQAKDKELSDEALKGVAGGGGRPVVDHNENVQVQPVTDSQPVVDHNE